MTINHGSRKVTVREALQLLLQGANLNRETAREVMREIMDGEATPAQIGSLLTLLRMKGETIEEITGFAQMMREKGEQLLTPRDHLLDTCGTGGDGANTFNISTATSIVAAAGGVRVAKHGNRAMSSKSGSADVLEALGVNITLGAEDSGRCLDEAGICFMFAQHYHPSMKHAAGPRKELGFRTIFNLLGPLTNPAGADRQLMGVYDASKTEIVAFVMRELGLQRALVVASKDGLDEISIAAPTRITELNEGVISTYDITPDDLGLESFPLTEIKGGEPEENAQIIRRVLNGEEGACRNVVLANAGACFYISGLSETLQEGVKMASRTIDSGEANRKLQQLITFTEGISHVS